MPASGKSLAQPRHGWYYHRLWIDTTRYSGATLRAIRAERVVAIA